MMHTKNYREVHDALAKKGIELLSTDHSSGGRSLLRLRRKGVNASIYAGLNNVHGRHMLNIVTAARNALRQRGAVFTEAELAEAPPAPPAPAPKTDKPPRHNTKLNRQEKADFYALVKSGTDFLEACTAFNIHVTTGGRIIVDGDGGLLNDKLDPKYHPAHKEDPPPAAAVVPVPEPVPAQAVFTMVEDVPRPKVSPLDPRLLVLAAEVSLMQERMVALQKNAAELGIVVVAELKVEWA